MLQVIARTVSEVQQVRPPSRLAGRASWRGASGGKARARFLSGQTAGP